jgi:ABC-type phosphate/phosphonate transport system substrate-binding protein
MYTLGAVAYDAKVVPIWDGFKALFTQQGLDFDYVLYTNYEAQVAAHLRGEINVAWNSPLAWLQTERAARRLGREARAVAMRDTDQDLRSAILVRSDAGLSQLADLAGRRVAVGASDSPQATLIPLGLLAEAGVDVTPVLHDRLVGKHGDHIGGERDAARALVEGRVDAACVLDANVIGFAADGTLPAGATRVLAHTAPFDHCCFTVLDDLDAQPLVASLLAMSWDDPSVRGLMDLEGLRAWVPGRTTGFAALARAVDRFGTLTPFLARVAP